MIKYGKTNLRSYMIMDYVFDGVCIEDGTLFPNSWKFSVDLTATARGNAGADQIEQVSKAATAAFLKIRYWLDTNLRGIVLSLVDNHSDFELAMHVNNPVMYVPGTLSDDVISQLLHAKISALAGTGLIVGALRIASSQSELRYAFDPAETGYNLPDTTEYFTYGKVLHDVPWWFRDDGFCVELPVPQDGSEHQYVDPMDKFLAPMESDTEEQPSTPGRVTRIDSWTPKKV
jgi:hypothetical protein